MARHRHLVAPLGVVSLGLALGGLAAASCSLGLDESLIGRPADAGARADGSVDGSTPADDGGDASPPSPEAGTCAVDGDCAGTTGCLTARCDVSRKACVHDVCRSQCGSAVCTVATGTCALPRPYKYRANGFAVAGPAGCGGALSRCFTAVYPFVFVGTATGVVAYAASDPQDPAPRTVPIRGLSFVPVQMVASGSRVFFLGTPAGTVDSSRVPLAWLDVPADPFATELSVTSILAAHNRPAADALALFPRQGDTALLVDLAATANLASTIVQPPLAEPLALVSTPITFTAGSTPVGTSGTRLVLGQTTATGGAIFGLVQGAGTPMPTPAVDTPIGTAAPAGAPYAFGQSADGALFWAYASLTAAPPGPPAPALRAVRTYFLLNQDGGAPDPATGLDIDVFGGAPLATASVGPVAMLDANTALVTTALPANPAQSNVQFVVRAPLGMVNNADAKPRRHTLAVPVSQLAAAGSHGIGYVLAATPTNPTVHVFDPACAP